MEYVFFDLEWNQPYFNDIEFLRRAKMPIAGEIIQIGAVKVDEKLQIIDHFAIIIKPRILTNMHKHVRSLTGIDNQAIHEGIPFEKGFALFKKWCGQCKILLSWGADDLLLMIDNMRLCRIEKQWDFTWYDAQGIYSYEREGEVRQISLSKALLEREIPMNLAVHNALHDAEYTSRLLQGIDLKEGLAHYDELQRPDRQPIIYPKSLAFFVYEGFEEKLQALNSNQVKNAYCPHCHKLLKRNTIEHTTGAKYLAIGTCEVHGRFALLWRIQKSTGSKESITFYATKNISALTKEIEVYYNERASMNRKKEEKYRAFIAAKEKERLAKVVKV